MFAADIYYVSFTSERLLITCSVYVIFALDILQSVIATVLGWQILCRGWGRPVVLENPGWSFPWTPIITGISMSPFPLHGRYRRLTEFLQSPSWYRPSTPGGSTSWEVGGSFQ